MMRFALVLTLGCAPALGCASAPPAAEPVAVESAGSDEPDHATQLSESQTANMQFSLERAALIDVARLLGRASGLRVVLDAEVDRVAECLTISVFEPNLITVDEAIAVTREAYAPLGVELQRTSTQLVFSLADDAPRRNCSRDYINPDLFRSARQTNTQPTTQRTSSQSSTTATPSSATPSSATPSSATPSSATPSSRRQSQSGLPPVVVDGIRTVSPTEVMITNAALDEVLANQATVFSAARLIPHEESGRVVAIKVYGIRRNSLLGRLGFRNGDGLQRVNGYALTSPDSALEAYARLRSATELRVELQRRGQSVTHTIRVVESLP